MEERPHGGFLSTPFLFGTLLADVIPRGGFGTVPSLTFLGYQSPNQKMTSLT